MDKKISRRNFFKSGLVLGTLSSFETTFLSKILHGAVKTNILNKDIEVAVASGDNYFENTKQTIEILGGINKFVPKNSRVLLLGNVWRAPGTFTKPEIFRAVAQMCNEAGSKKITCISMMPPRNWDITGNKVALEKEGVELKLFDYKDNSKYTSVPIPKGIILKKAEVLKELFSYDVFINIPICKDHISTVFSCTMKNLMGVTSYRCNRKFHVEEWDLKVNKADYLAQCIADLNTIINPTLNVVDATEFISTNGPMGPGKIIKPLKVVAGVDRIAIDAYCITLLDRKIDRVLKVRKGYDHGLGEIDISKVRIKEVYL